MEVASVETDSSTLGLPRMLCLHGGGTNARIFRLQCRILERELRPTFRLCFAEGPYPSQPGPDVTSVYKDFGPFRSWLPDQKSDSAKVVENPLDDLQKSLEAAMYEDDQKGAHGDWVALLGFSQGAKVCASLLLAQQNQAEDVWWHKMGVKFRFAVLLAGRGPLISTAAAKLATSQQTTASSLKRPPALREPILHMPTIHVHGLQDPGLELHRRMLYRYCDKSRSVLIEWEGEHRVPIKTDDVTLIVRAITAMAQTEGTSQI